MQIFSIYKKAFYQHLKKKQPILLEPLNSLTTGPVRISPVLDIGVFDSEVKIPFFIRHSEI